MIEEHVINLARLQADRKVVEDDVTDDPNVTELAEGIAIMEMQMAEAHKTLVFLRAGYDTRISEIDDEIKHVSAQIIDEWTGEHKTMVFGDRVLKFRQTGSLKIHDELYLFAELYDHIKLDVLIEKYLKGFNLTAVKKYMDLYELPIDVAEIEYKTTVKLEQKSG